MPIKRKSNEEVDIYKTLSETFNISEKELRNLPKNEIQELIKIKEENENSYSKIKGAAKTVKGKVTGKSAISERVSKLSKEQIERIRSTKTWNNYYQRLYPPKGLRSINMTDKEYEHYIDTLVLAPKVDASNPMKSFDSFCDTISKK